MTAKSSSNNSRGWPPVTTLIPSSSKLCAAGFSSKGLPSLTVTIAPKRSNKRAADSPDLAKPNTRTFLFSNCFTNFMISSLHFYHSLFYLFLAKLKSPKGFKNHVSVYFFCLVVILEISTKAR